MVSLTVVTSFFADAELGTSTESSPNTRDGAIAVTGDSERKKETDSDAVKKHVYLKLDDRPNGLHSRPKFR